MTQAMRRPALAVLLLVLATLGTQAATSAAPAKADYCFGGDPTWNCTYANESIAAYTKRWFQAATTLRNWLWNEANDYYGGTVYKCAGYKRQSNGGIYYLACANGFQHVGASIPAEWRPGWVFIEQRANGPRDMNGTSFH
jgi:hypothetical protein